MIAVTVVGAWLALAPAGLPEPYRGWLEEEVPYIVSTREKEEFLTLETDRQRDAFIDEFWRRRDPDLSTENNEFREEHYRRIAYANARFDKEGKPGWKTARGRIYIIHGPPDDVRYYFGRQVRATVYNPTPLLNPGGGPAPLVEVALLSPESETWTYHHLEGVRAFSSLFTVIFAKMDRGPLLEVERLVKRTAVSADANTRGQRDGAIKGLTSVPGRYLRNDYRIVYAGQPRYLDVEDLMRSSFDPFTPAIDRFLLHEAQAELERSSGEYLEEKLRRQERLRQLVESRVFFGHLPVEVGVGFLRLPRGRVHIPLHARIQVPSDPPAPAIELLAELHRQPNGRLAATLADEIVGTGREPLAGEVSYQSRLVAPPGVYQLRVTAVDEANQRLGVWEEELEVPNLNGTEFGASELVLCDQVVPRKEFGRERGKGRKKGIEADRQAPLTLDEYIFVPVVDHQFRRRQNLTTLLEVYNPSLESGAPQVRIQSAFVQANGRSMAFPVRSLDYLSGGKDTIIYAFTVPLRELDPGHYQFQVQITDAPTGRVVSKSAPLQIR